MFIFGIELKFVNKLEGMWSLRYIFEKNFT